MYRYKKIQLVSPPSNRTVEGQQKWAHWPQPLGLLSMATYVNSILPDIEFEILDYDSILKMENESDLNKIGNADLVGISMNFAQIDRGLEIARLAKSRGSDVVVGGNIVTAIDHRILRYHPYVDYCIVHDGEDSILELIKGTELSNVPNLLWRDNGNITKNQHIPVDLRKLPIIDRSYIDFDSYIKNAIDGENDFIPLPYFSRPTNMYSQKGCAWRASEGGGCYFCSIHDRGLRTRAPKQVWEERKQLVDKYNVNYIWDPSDNFLADPEWFKEFVAVKPEGFDVPFSNYIRIDSVNEDVAKALSKIGCKQVFCGMESGSDEALKLLNKGIRKDMIETALKILAKNEITVVFGIVIGAKGETQDNVIETMEYMRYLNETYDNLDRFEWGTLAPLPGSKAFDEIMNHEELKAKYSDFGKGNIMSTLEHMVEDWPKYMCGDGIDFEYFLYIQQLAQEHLPYKMTRYQKRAWSGTVQKTYWDGQLIKGENC